jgi:calcineurin-like phosphoesterase family protein
MSRVFLYSDPHFSHAGVCKFLREDGTKLRPWLSPDDMDRELVQRFNQTVGEHDKCYVLGDVAINRRGLNVLAELKCKNMVLIKGNHDIFKPEDYAPWFRDVRSYHVMNGIILSHIPIHEASLGRFGGNFHGHTHAGRVRRPRGVDVRTGQTLYSDQIDPRYFCVCVEQTDYRPILFERALEQFVQQGGHAGFRNTGAAAL